MDQNANVQLSSTPPIDEIENKRNKKNISITILLIIVVVIIIVAALLLLYFLSKNSTKNLLTRATSTPTITQNATPTPDTLLTAIANNYQQYQAMQAYLKSTINPTYQLINQKFSKDAANQYSLLLNLQSSAATISAKETTKFNTNNITDSLLKISYTTQDIKITNTLADQLAHTFFSISSNPNSWTCSQDTQRIFCYTKINGTDKADIYTIYSASGLPNKVFVISCSLTKQSSLYAINGPCFQLK